MIVIITGTPGTGKTVISKKLAKKLNKIRNFINLDRRSRLKWKLIDIKKIVDRNKDIYYIEKNEKIVDIKELRKIILKRINTQSSISKQNFIIEGHLACEIKLPADFVFVLRCEPETLRERLRKRRYPKKKIDENILAEILDYCTQVAKKKFNSKILEIDTSKRNIKNCVDIIIKVIRGKKRKLDDIDYSKRLRKSWNDFRKI